MKRNDENNSVSDEKEDLSSKGRPYEIHLSPRLFAACLLLTFIIPFFAGAVAAAKTFHLLPRLSRAFSSLDLKGGASGENVIERVNSVIVDDFDAAAVSNSDDDGDEEEDEDDVDENEGIETGRDDDEEDEDDYNDEEEEEEEEEEEYLGAAPPGTALQLSVDIRNIDPSFLMSRDALHESMIKIASKASLRLLSFHCRHKTKSTSNVANVNNDDATATTTTTAVPLGLNCIGVLSKGSHVSLNTWLRHTTKKDADTAARTDDDGGADVGAVLFSLLSGGPDQLKLQWDVLPFVEREFAARGSGGDKGGVTPVVEWSLVQRQFRVVAGYPRNVYWGDIWN
mmetsp:Transcript_12738/g.16094  ORF Transcript_12738/g.16094 Transcript_12738/m.16094 type:complete len:340 (+) Transcript_12738:268-1287(+)